MSVATKLFTSFGLIATMKLLIPTLLLLRGTKASDIFSSSTNLTYYRVANRTLVRVEDKMNYLTTTLVYPTTASGNVSTSSNDSMPLDKPTFRLLLPPVGDRTLCTALPPDLTYSPRRTSPSPIGLLIDSDIANKCMFVNVLSNIVLLNQILPAGHLIEFLVIRDLPDITYNRLDILQSNPIIASILKDNNLALLYVQESGVQQILDSIGAFFRRGSFATSSTSPYLLDYGSWNFNLQYQVEAEGVTYEPKFPNLYKFGMMNLIFFCCVALSCFCCIYARRMERRLLFSDDPTPQVGFEHVAKVKVTLLSEIDFNKLPTLKYQCDLSDMLKDMTIHSIFAMSEKLNIPTDDERTDLNGSAVDVDSGLEELDANVSTVNNDDDEQISVTTSDHVLESNRDNIALESQLEFSLPWSREGRSSSLKEGANSSFPIQKNETCANEDTVDVDKHAVPESTAIVAQSSEVAETTTQKGFDCISVTTEARSEDSDGNSGEDDKQLNNSTQLTDESDECCPICLDDFIADEYVTILQGCKHYYHRRCVREWLLRKQGCCPLCKVDVVIHDLTLEDEKASAAWNLSIFKRRSNHPPSPSSEA